MRQYIAIALLIFTIVFFSVLVGFYAGINHAIQNSRITVEENEVLIDLDGELYVHELK